MYVNKQPISTRFSKASYKIKLEKFNKVMKVWFIEML